MRFLVSSLLLPFMLLLVACRTHKEPASPPNIVVILIDDAGYADFGFMGSTEIETPELDKIAAQGVVFSDAHVSATVCAPSRAGLLSGRYQQRFGFECNIPPVGEGIATSEQTIGDALQQAGYHTAIIGKWHVGETPLFHPNQRGFDTFFGFLGGSRSYFPIEGDVRHDHQLMQNQEIVGETKGYLTDIFGDRAVAYIEKHKSEPFFLLFAPNAVHTPLHAKESHLRRYEGHPRPRLAAMTWSLDENVGKIRAKLAAEGLLENTLFFILSDNGGALPNSASNDPLKGWKGNKYEGGHRIPFVMSWPAKVKGGRTYHGLSSALDIYATAVAAAGLEAGQLKKEIDGVDLVPYLRGEKKGHPHDKLYWRKDQMAGMRHHHYKLIRLEDFGFRLYDLSDDLSETVDLRDSLATRFEVMKKDLQTWEMQMTEPLWLESRAWSEVTYEIHRALMENRKPHFLNPAERRAFQEKESR